MKALVTGVAGFIGSHIASRLLMEGHEVVGVDDLSAGYVYNVPRGVFFYLKDICRIEQYTEVLDDVDVVFHQAASKKNICMSDPVRDMKVNGIATLRLLQQCVKKGVKKFVHASTGSVYGEVNGEILESAPRNPCSYYGISKMAGESYVDLYNKMFGLDTTILRYFHVYGPRQEKKQRTGGVVAIFSNKIQQAEPLIIHGDGTQKRVFTHVDDIVEANMKAWRNPLASGKVYNCASSVQTSINELAEMLMSKYNIQVPVNYEDSLPGDIYNFNVSTERIKEIGVVFHPINEKI